MKIIPTWVKIIAVLYIGLFVMACPTETEKEEEKKVSKDNLLTIENSSSYTISNVSWRDNVIKSGTNLTINKNSSGSAMVQSDSGYLYFTKEGTPAIKLHTRDSITVSGTTTFTITDTTMVHDGGTPANTGSLSTIPSGASTVLKIKNESTWTISDIKWQNQSITPSSLEPGSSGTISLTKGASGYIFFRKVLDSSGNKNSGFDCRTQSVVEVGAEKTGEFVFIDNTVVVETDDTTNVQPLGTIVRTPTELTIKNQSFSDLLSVEWQGVTFRSNTVENSIPVGHTAKQDVSPGSGYIFFRRKSNPAFARTQDVVTLGSKESKEFVFADTTLIVEANNPDNTGALKDMKTTVVFFDDAEGELQGYAERKGSAYYAETSDLPYKDGGTYFHPPYTGSGKSIALGGIIDAKLRLTLNLERKAKLSFWYANKDYDSRYAKTNGATFSIDGTEKAAWQGDYNWSNQEYTLEAGAHEIVWTKHGYSSSSSSSSYFSYLSLDNILVFYIE